MTTIAKLLVGLGIDAGEYNSGLAASVSETQKFSSSIGSLGKLAAGVAVSATAALISVATGAGVAFAGFQNQMAEVFTLLPNASDAAMAKMTSQVKAFSLEFGVLPDKLIPALYESISSGIPADNVFTFLETAQQAAKAGVTDLKITVDGLTSVVNAYGQSNISAAQASDLMFTAVKFGKTTFEQLSTSLYNVTPVAASLGLSFDNVTAALASMTLQGVPTATATTQLRQMLVELSDSGTEVAKTFEKVSGQSFRAFIASGGNLQGALQLLEKAAVGGGKGINELFGSVEAGGAALALTGTGTQQFTSAIDAMANSAGSTGAAYKIMNSTIAASGEKIKAAGAVFLVTIGEKLAPSIAKLAASFATLLQSKGAMDFIEAFGTALAKVVDLVLASAGTFANLAKSAFGWGKNISGSFAGGILAAAKEVVAALKTLGSIIAGWLKPGSPPKITPDLDKWGSEAGQLYINNWANVDYSILSSIGDAIQSTLRGLADVGQFGEEGIIPAVLLGRQGVAKAINEINSIGSVSESTFNGIISSIGPAGAKVANFVKSYFELTQATRKVKQAQDDLNRATEHYKGILAPLNSELGALQNREKEIRGMQRVQELNKTIADEDASELDKELARNELAQMDVEKRITAVESERDAVVTAAQEKVAAAELEQSQAQSRVDTEQKLLDIGNQTNSLIGQQIQLLNTAATSAGGAAGGIGDIAGSMSGLSEGLAPVSTLISDVNTAAGVLNYKFLEANMAIGGTIATVSAAGGMFSSFAAGFTTHFQPAIDSTIERFNRLGEIVDQALLIVNTTIWNYGAQIKAGWDGTFNQFVATVNTVFLTVNGIFTSAMGILLAFMQRNGQDISDTFAQALLKLSGIASSALGLVSVLFNAIMLTWVKFTTEHGDSIKHVLDNAWIVIKNVVLGALEIIGGLLKAALQLFQGDWQGAWETIRTMSEGVVKRIYEAIGAAFEIIAGFFGTTGAKIVQSWADSWNMLVSITGTMVQRIRDKGTEFFNAGKAIIQNMIDGIKAMAQSAVDAVNEVLQQARDLLPGSEPRDRSSPLANLGRAGRAFSNNFIEGAVSGWDIAWPDMLNAILDSVGEMGRQLEGYTDEMIRDMQKNFLSFVKDFANASAGIARGVAENFADLYELGKATGPEKALQDANKAFAESKKNLDGITSELAEVQHLIANAEASKPIVFDEESAKRAEEHQRYLNGLYDQQNKLLLDQNDARNQTRYLEVKAQEQGAQTTQQRNGVLAIAEQAKQQYAALEKQVNELLAAGKSAEAIAIFDEESARIAELADLRQRRALSTDFNEQSFLDTQIRLVEAAQRSEKEAQKVELIVNLQADQTEEERFMILLTAAFEAMGISADILVRSN